MIIDSKNIEFGYELISVIPYAYYHRDQLKLTVSGNDTESLYFFSPKHKINTKERKFEYISEVECPNRSIHKPYLDKTEFEIPPYKEHFANDEFKYDKEIIVICNRANIEWGYKMINYFNVDTLKSLFELLQDKYQVIYINVEGRKELYDSITPVPIGDFELLKKYPKVINFHDLVKDSWNETQLKIFANCEKFITMNGGHSILASYFGGENIIMSKYGKIQTRELDKGINSFYTFYHEFSGSRTVHVENEKELIKRVKLQWINNNPIVNILVRTSGRPEFFASCIESIEKQTYKNVNIFVSIDNKNDKYTTNERVYPVRVKKIRVIGTKSGKSYGSKFPANLYFNELHKHVKSGLILYLDDDDKLTDRTALRKIVNEYKKGNNLIYWKVKIGNNIVPSDKNFGFNPVCCDISGIGFAFDQKYKLKWEPYKRGDFRIAKKLHINISNKTYINEILTETQGEGNGFGLKKDKNYNDMENVKIYFVNARKGSKYKNGDTIELPLYLAKKFVIIGAAVFEEDKKAVKKKLKVVPAKKKRGRPVTKKNKYNKV